MEEGKGLQSWLLLTPGGRGLGVDPPCRVRPTLRLSLLCDQRVSPRGQPAQPQRLNRSLLLCHSHPGNWLPQESECESVSSPPPPLICSPRAVPRPPRGSLCCEVQKRAPESSDTDWPLASGQVISCLWFLPLSELEQFLVALKI